MHVFNSPYKTTESWTAQGAIIQYYITGQEAEKIPLVIAGLEIGFAQQQTPFYQLNADESGGGKRIVVKGAPQGSLSITSIYCPTPGKIKEFLAAASRDCVTAGNDLVITVRPFGDIKCGNESVTDAPVITLTGVELASLGFSIQSGAVTLVNMPLAFSFTDMDIE